LARVKSIGRGAVDATVGATNRHGIGLWGTPSYSSLGRQEFFPTALEMVSFNA